MNAPAHHHQAMLYRSTDELLQRACPLLDDGVRRGYHVAAMLDTPTAETVRDELGGNAASVRFHAPADLLGVPPQALLTAHYQAVEAQSSTAPLVILSQRQPWMAPWDVAFVEAALNPLLSELNVTMICATAAEPPFDEIYRQTHPELIDADGSDGARANHAYRDPADVVAAYPAPPPEPLADPLSEETISSAGQLHDLRRAVRGHAAELGLAPTRVADLQLAVTEVATNCLRRGACGVLRLAVLADRLVFELRDPGRVGPMYGLLPPPLATETERAFWLARQLCDTVYVWHDAQGTGLRAACGPPG